MIGRKSLPQRAICDYEHQYPSGRKISDKQGALCLRESDKVGQIKFKRREGRK